ncbi:MAG: cellulase family glycosylhydrolase [Bifidobacteriaceae bacterium]|jgi:hypothetical protein|nr:cellulase family glycosylhydrolase [Bifidobacteriaceae bacterium]
MDSYSDVRGFNYQPGHGTTSLENWYYFDADMWELELRRGKAHFPKFNMVRYWLSWDAYSRKPEAFKANFEKAVAIADALGIKVMPCLFNRWHDASGYDCGGVYLEQILVPTAWSYYRPRYREYVADLVSEHVGDERIAIWDLCNEPFSYDELTEETRGYAAGEIGWLTELYQTIKERDPAAKVGVSIHNGHNLEDLDWVDPISDVLLIHPYFICTPEQIWDEAMREKYLADVQYMVDFGRKAGKPMLATETCWGALKDSDRVDIVRFTLDTLASHNLGFLVHALHYSLVADLHDPVDGSVGHSYNLAFTTKDGAIRPGHEIFNQY